MKKWLSLIAVALLSVAGTFAADKADNANSRRDDRPAAASRAKVDINTADAATLEALPGVGPVIAQEIIAHRPFKNAEELKDIKGIGDVRYGELRPLITVSHGKGPGAREAKKAEKETRKSERASSKAAKKSDKDKP